MTEQHLLDNGYRKYPGYKDHQKALYQKLFVTNDIYYYINVEHNVWPDRWEHWGPSVQIIVGKIGDDYKTINIEAVQWYNTHPTLDTSSHDICHAEEFFARAVEALGLQEEECMR